MDALVYTSGEHFAIEEETTSDNFSFTDSNWKAQLIDGASNNQVIYEAVVSRTEQTGCTGIVTIPNAGVTFDKTYGDLLLQAIIDCNFKFRTTF